MWDFGGQEEYRDKYLITPEKFFFGIDLIIYVIDIQDTQRYEESLDYFKKIVDIIKRLEENPYILVFIHKYDPDIRDSEEISLNVEYLKEKITNLLKDKKLDYDIYLSSIFSMISNEPKFSKYIKDIMKETTLTSSTQTKIDGMGNIVETTLNSVIRLSESIMTQFKELEVRIATLEASKGTSAQAQNNLPQPMYSSKPLPPPPPPPSATQKAQEPRPSPASVRSAIIGELKELFSKKKKLDIT